MYKLIYLARRNPSISIEDWPRTWRSHAVFASQFPVMETELQSLFYCCRIVEPTLDGEPLALPEVSTGHDGVAVVASPKLSNLTGSMVSPEDQLRIEEDERRVFGQLVQGNITFACTERVIVPGTQGKAAIFRFLKARNGFSRAQFEDAWGGVHAQAEVAALARANGLKLSAHNQLVRDPPELLPFDGISETWFTSPEDAMRSLTDGTHDAITESLSEFCDIAGGVTMLTRVCHSWPRV